MSRIFPLKDGRRGMRILRGIVRKDNAVDCIEMLITTRDLKMICIHMSRIHPSENDTHSDLRGIVRKYNAMGCILDKSTQLK